MKSKSKKSKENVAADRTAIIRRGQRRRTATAFVIILLLIVGATLSLTVFFSIEEVRVEGSNRYYSADQILSASGIEKGKNIFLFSSKRAEERLWATLPYIDNISVRRELPGTVIIDISVSSDSVALPYDGGCLVLSDRLKIVDIVSGESSVYTKVYGIQPSSCEVGVGLETEDENGTQYLAAIVSALSDSKLLNVISDINVSDKLNLSLVYDNRIFVMLGTASNIDYKIEMLAALSSDKLSDTDTGYLDL
ncbi:MAG: FtsQ-type POTRA domain-containing protein, partial [Oscillospiraceae bacterium]